jgi:uncharacterized protein YoxC
MSITDYLIHVLRIPVWVMLAVVALAFLVLGIIVGVGFR